MRADLTVSLARLVDQTTSQGLLVDRPTKILSLRVLPVVPRVDRVLPEDQAAPAARMIPAVLILDPLVARIRQVLLGARDLQAGQVRRVQDRLAPGRRAPGRRALGRRALG